MKPRQLFYRQLIMSLCFGTLFTFAGIAQAATPSCNGKPATIHITNLSQLSNYTPQFYWEGNYLLKGSPNKNDVVVVDLPLSIRSFAGLVFDFRNGGNDSICINIQNDYQVFYTVYGADYLKTTNKNRAGLAYVHATELPSDAVVDIEADFAKIETINGYNADNQGSEITLAVAGADVVTGNMNDQLEIIHVFYDPQPIEQNLEINTGSGNDVIYVSANSKFYPVKIRGGDGDDLIDIQNSSESPHLIYGGYGDDIIFGSAGNDSIYGGKGKDYISGGNGKDILFGGDDPLSDGYTSETDPNDIHGGEGNDLIYGEDGNDEIYGEDGNDALYGYRGNDTIKGGDGDDDIEGGDGNNLLYGDGDNDTINGGKDRDRIWGGEGNDRLFGNGGNDDVYGENGDDYLRGGDGNDVVKGGKGNDQVRGDDDNDDVYGNENNDYILGGPGVDTLHGGSGDDTLRGEDGVDTLDGESGTDDCYGGTGADVLTSCEK